MRTPLIFVIFAGGCILPLAPYAVTRPSPDNLAKGASRVFLCHLDTGGISIDGKSEDEFLRNRAPEQLANWRADLEAMAGEYLKGVADGLQDQSEHQFRVGFSDTPPPAGAISIALHIRTVDVPARRIDADAEILGAGGGREDVHFSEPMNRGVNSISDEIRAGARALGLGISRYLHDRARAVAAR
jgi:hypothetical protein